MLIAYVEKCGKSKQKITLADGDSFILPERDWKAFGAEAGEDMDDALLEKLYQEYLLTKAKLRALNLLKVRDRSHKELVSRLKQDGYPRTIIQQAMDYVDSYHYVDDIRFAKNYIEYKGGRKSRRELAYELSKKGIDVSALAEREDGMALPDDKETIRALLEKRWGEAAAPDTKEKERMMRYLGRRGFRGGDILSVYRDLGI